MPRHQATPAAQPYEPKKLTPEQSIAPGKFRSGERLRSMYTQGMRISRMLPETRLVGLTLLGYANFQTGLIHARWQPTPGQLADATGLAEDRVRVHLEVLRQRGWMVCRTLAEGPRAGDTVQQLTVPALVLEQMRARFHENRQRN
jgi:hypothetical protein